MTTAQQIVNGATEKIGVKTAETALESEDAQTVFNEMNDMLNEWADIGLTKSFTTVSDLTDDVDIDRNAVGAVKNNLAIRIAPSFERVVTPVLASIADSTLSMLRASTIFIGEVALPDNLPVGSGNSCSDFFGEDRFFNQNKKENF